MKNTTTILLAFVGILFFGQTFAQATMSKRTFYNFNVGDVIQKEYDEQNYNTDSPAYVNYIIDSFVSKKFSQNNTAVQYIFTRQFVKTITPAPAGYFPSISTTTDTVLYTNLDSVPDFSVGHSLCSQQISVNQIWTDPSQCNDTVWTIEYGFPLVCGQGYVCDAKVNYYQGLGGPYYNSSSSTATVDKHLNIIFYKKGSLNCGTRVDLKQISSGVSTIEQLASSIKILPNPSNGNFTIEKSGTDDLKLNLYNLIGEKVMATQLTASKTVVNQSNLPKGMYLYSLTTTVGSIVKSGKLVIE